ncbi:RNA-binding S4 domain-containing protein [Corynebacterium bovis]|uniref:RNA-binding S4 domain-containing protein n=3 Tax=Corynebacterium bovis TaxID=36808 RepID=A0A3R8QLV1_9CORY|nr:RNA-binding S4 domain-containing protein [Corynebacterium bovis]MBB3115863.1 ribosome-associated protein YbcJ (S4-like RNA binding protein) [Corynebacterium bovis DSM 20582 = CIP 54.80]MDK8510922.1 RNA-binding S4 domain-containing protein [Corynebacterium bovis]MDN8578936.1 RNA-binding S4 domain-containing protein [Corynebacterium bovis]QQC46828.1 RNA-binding S4 domain-containing protein [Corynebacterium bovis]RRO85984.1 RNA-binding S4 domain-containing protein [Corynebacterium bovis]
MHTPDAPEVPVTGGGIRLGQFIKLAGLVETGGTAKELVAGGRVTVNGAVDTRRGRQLGDGDRVAVLHDVDGPEAAVARVALRGETEDDDVFDENTADDDFDPEKWRNL